MITREMYLNKEVSFEEYYTSIAKEAGIGNFNKTFIDRVKLALKNGDEHLNTIPLSEWDRMAYPRPSLNSAFIKHDDFYSLAGGVCVYKQAAKNQANKENEIH